MVTSTEPVTLLPRRIVQVPKHLHHHLKDIDVSTACRFAFSRFLHTVLLTSIIGLVSDFETLVIDRDRRIE